MKFIIPGVIIFFILVGAVSVMSDREPSGPETWEDAKDEAPEDEGRIVARIDEGGSTRGVKVIPHEVLEDSRCPLDVQCIWAGTVRVRTTLESGMGPASQIFELGQPVTTEAEVVTLVGIEPAPTSGEVLEPEDYVFYFTVDKR